MYASRVMEVEQATFTPLVFTTTGGIAPECQVYLIFLSLLVHVEIVADFKEELVKRCQVLVVISNSNSNTN